MERVKQLLLHARTQLAARAAVAAAASWVLAQQLPDPLRQYPYYAPLGAILGSRPTIAQSLRGSMQNVAGLTLGSLVAVGAGLLGGRGPWSVAAVVAIAVLLGGLHFLGEGSSYVPISAVFVLVAAQDRETYAASYAALVLLGALVAVMVNLVAPELPLSRADRSLAQLRDAVATHLDRYADRLADGDRPPTARDGLPRLDPLRAQATEVVHEAHESQRGNVRARRNRGAVEVRTERLNVLRRCVVLVEDLDGLSSDRPWGEGIADVPDELRSPMSGALRQLAGNVRGLGQEVEDRARARDVDDAVQRLSDALNDRHDHYGPVEVVAATVLTSLRRTVAVIAAQEGDDRSSDGHHTQGEPSDP
ncbi:aromatic acid exporter family protein [Isoptericola sp. b490]|uniref:FUSC family protein n=1 Tax=Actinotalea lenta TaxID=3064654 RepID=UPI0027143F9A|nr:aromatic acid exporter family protein [Isoptericola sp. b490]MDO8122077.1 aromatic acid exporter family protein [Isoptericola sp. b490]